jgi:hypothetical protein
MAEDQQHEDSQKTLVAFVVGLLIGGMLVWAFSGPSKSTPKEETKTDGVTASTTDQKTDEASKGNEPAKLQVGEGKIVVEDQKAGKFIEMKSAEYPVGEGWIGIRQYDNDKLGYILGVNRFSAEQGLVPEKIELLYPTTKGKKYAVVVFKEDGDRKFNLSGDVQLDTIYSTFTAQ